MSSKHYDIAIIGGSLSARIAAALLAKQGNRVLFLRHREATATPWFHSSLFLEKLLGTLGGRSCFVAQQPIQVLSAKARITLSNDVSLEDELKRELGAAGAAASAWLERLRAFGEQLESLLWENGGLPWPALKATARFKLLCVRYKVNRSDLDTPLQKQLGKLPGTAIPLVTDLLQGLAMRRIDQLTFGRTALLWAQANRPENLKEPDFSDLLSKRFEQFHGLKDRLSGLDSFDYSGSRWNGGRMKDGSRFSADTFLLGDVRWSDRFNLSGKTAPAQPQPLLKQSTDDLTGQLSVLLANRVICGGEVPLSLAIETDADRQHGLVLSPCDADEEQIREQLQPALPFARYRLETQQETDDEPVATTTTSPQHNMTALPLRIGGNLFCADSNALLPELGAAGAALTGWTLAENLGVARKAATK